MKNDLYTKGFTLIELLIAVAIIAILAAIAMPYFEHQKTAALQAAVGVYLNGLADQATAHYAFYGHYPKLADLGFVVASSSGSGEIEDGNGGGGGNYFGFSAQPINPQQLGPQQTQPNTSSNSLQILTDSVVVDAIAGQNVNAESVDIVNAGYRLRFIWFAMGLNADGTYKNAVGIGHPIQGNKPSFIYTGSTWVDIIALNLNQQNEKTTLMLNLGELFPDL